MCTGWWCIRLKSRVSWDSGHWLGGLTRLKVTKTSGSPGPLGIRGRVLRTLPLYTPEHTVMHIFPLPSEKVFPFHRSPFLVTLETPSGQKLSFAPLHKAGFISRGKECRWRITSIPSSLPTDRPPRALVYYN